MNGESPTWIPLVGAVEVVVDRVTPVSIHGDPYVDLVVAPDGGAPAAFRVAAQQFESSPAPGDRVRLHLLMSQVDRVETLPSA